MVPHFVRWMPEETERLWCQNETDLPKVFKALKEGALLEQPALVAKAKQCIALHFARSKAVFAVHVQSARNAASDRARKLYAQPQVLDQLFHQKTGLYPPTRREDTESWWSTLS